VFLNCKIRLLISDNVVQIPMELKCFWILDSKILNNCNHLTFRQYLES